MAILLCLFYCLPTCVNAPLTAKLKTSISRKEAIVKAQQFIVEQGYTDSPADTKKKHDRIGLKKQIKLLIQHLI